MKNKEKKRETLQTVYSDTKKTAKKLYWIEMEQSGKSNVSSEVRTFDIK